MNHSQAIQKLIAVIRRQHKAFATEKRYVYWLNRYIHSIQPLDPLLPSEKKAEHFLNQLAQHRDISAATQHQAFNAIMFFYKDVLDQPLQNVNSLRVRRPAQVRQAPTIQEVQTLLKHIPNVSNYPTKLVAHLLYGCGLRVTEPLNLRIRDVRLDRSTLGGWLQRCVSKPTASEAGQ